MKKHFFVLSFTALSVIALGAVAVSARPAQVTKTAAVSKATPSFDGETQYTGEALKVRATSSSVTDFSVSYQITYSTGGMSVRDNAGSGSFVYVFGNKMNEEDQLLQDYAEEYRDWPEDVQKELRDKITLEDLVEGKKPDTKEFSSYIFRFSNDKVNVFVPRTISMGTYQIDSVYDALINEIGEHAFNKGAEVENIYIPKEVLTIHANSFEYAKNLTDIYCEATSAPEGWEAGWDQGKEVHWGEKIYSYAPSSKRADYEHASCNKLEPIGDDNHNFIFGYWPDDKTKDTYPLTVEYKIQGETTVNYVEIEKNNDYAEYDSVGGAIGTGSSINPYSNSFYLDINIKKGQQVDFSSIIVHNIFEAVGDDSSGVLIFYPDYDTRSYISPAKVFSDDKVRYLDEYISNKFSLITNFAGYTCATSSMSKVKSGIEIYKKAKPHYYDIYEKNLKSGKAVVRYRLTQLGKASYIVDYGNGAKSVKPKTEISQYILRNEYNNNVGFLFKNSQLNDSNYSFKNIKSFAIKGMTLTIDIVNDGTIMKTTAARARFGLIYVKAPTDSQKTFNADLLLVFLSVGYTAAALALSTVLFFVYKNVFKNDEFRRLKPKQFIRKAIIYWATSLVVVLMIAFTVLRCTAFANVIVVYNPVDVFIVVSGIASIIIIGYFIKNFVTASKARKQRKKAIKLGLVNEVADDGTK